VTALDNHLNLGFEILPMGPRVGPSVKCSNRSTFPLDTVWPGLCRFAAIKAAICSPKHSSSRSRSSSAFQQQHPEPASSPAPAAAGPSDSEPPSTPPPAAVNNPGHSVRTVSASKQQHSSALCSPPASGNGSRSGPGVSRPPSLDGARSPLTSTSSDLATAVAAALSPRANAAQAEALAGLFGGKSPGGRLSRSMTGAVSGGGVSRHSMIEWQEGGALSLTSPGSGKPMCARRVTWCAADEPLSPPGACGLGGRGVSGGSIGSSAGGRSSGGGVVLRPAGGTSILEPPFGHKVNDFADRHSAAGPAGWRGAPYNCVLPSCMRTSFQAMSGTRPRFHCVCLPLTTTVLAAQFCLEHFVQQLMSPFLSQAAHPSPLLVKQSTCLHAHAVPNSWPAPCSKRPQSTHHSSQRAPPAPPQPAATAAAARCRGRRAACSTHRRLAACRHLHPRLGGRVLARCRQCCRHPQLLRAKEGLTASCTGRLKRAVDWVLACAAQRG
jgi:hypothetical protein